MFCVIRSSLLLTAFAQACEGKCPLFHYVCQNFSFKTYTRAGVAADGKRGVISRPVKVGIDVSTEKRGNKENFSQERLCLLTPAC